MLGSPPDPLPPAERLPMRLVPTEDLGTAFLMGLAALLKAFLGCDVTFCVAFFSCFVPPWTGTPNQLRRATPAHDRERTEELCVLRVLRREKCQSIHASSLCNFHYEL